MEIWENIEVWEYICIIVVLVGLYVIYQIYCLRK
jgi:hypothetical protein